MVRQDQRIQLMRRLAQRPAGPFHYADLRPDWTGLPIGEKVQLGHAFLAAVRAGQLPGVSDSGGKDAAGRLYHWAGPDPVPGGPATAETAPDDSSG